MMMRRRGSVAGEEVSHVQELLLIPPTHLVERGDVRDARVEKG